VIDAARAVAKSLESLRAALTVAASSEAVGRIRLTAPVAFARSRLLPVLGEFRSTHPSVILDIRASDEMVDLADAGVDLALRAGEISGVPGHLRQTWFEFNWIACASLEYIAAHGEPRTPAELRQHDTIGFRNRASGLAEPWWFAASEGSGASERSTYNFSVVLDDAESVRHAVKLGMGVAWVPSWLVTQELARDGMVEVLPQWRALRSPMTILRRASPQTPSRVLDLIGFLRSKAGLFNDGK
jgi:DNA-binding transcriptional LysR family regulator